MLWIIYGKTKSLLFEKVDVLFRPVVWNQQISVILIKINFDSWFRLNFGTVDYFGIVYYYCAKHILSQFTIKTKYW